MLARLGRTKLERSGKGNVTGFLVGLGKIMRREGRTQQKQVIQKMCPAVCDGAVGEKAFFPHGQ